MPNEATARAAKAASVATFWLPAAGERWEAYVTDDEPPELAFYCPECAEREFGGD
jgi:hypothetical protein